MPVPTRTSEDPDASPPLSDVAARAAIAVGWRFVAFAAAGVLFLLLTSLTRWQRTFAPSQAWLEVIGERAKEPGQGPWMEVLSRVVRKMNEPPSSAKFEDADDFFAAVRTTWEGMPVEAFPEEIRAEIGERRQSQPQLKALRSKRSELLGSFDAELDSLVSELRSETVTVKTAEKSLETSTQFPAPVADARLEWDLRRLNEKRASLATRRQTVIDHIAQRNATEQSVNKAISTQEDRAQQVEASLRRAFDAVAGSARPVPANLHHFLEPRTALKIGDGQHPLHILYVVTWYGLECSIALLISIVLVPWLLRLAGGSGDVREVRSTITSRIKGWVEDALGQGAKVIVAGAAATAIAGATIAATPQESRPTVQVFVAPVTMAEGESGGQGPRGERGLNGEIGRQGDRGEKGDRGDVGAPGGGGEGPGEPPPDPSECLACLEAIEGESARLDRLVADVGSVSTALASFVASASQELKTLSARSTESLAYERQIATSASQCVSAQEGIQKDLANVERRVTGVEGRLSELTEVSREGTRRLGARADEVLQLQRETVDKVRGLSPMIGDVLRVAAGPEGALKRWLFRHDYRVTPEALAMIGRGLSDATNGDGQRLVEALGKIDNLRRNASDFRNAIEERLGPKPPENLKKLLEQSMPLIYWACRAPKPGDPS